MYTFAPFRKYLQLAKTTFQEYFVYRLNFVLWRFRSFVFLLTLFFFWVAIYGNKTEVFGYKKEQMITYVIGIALLRSIVLASRSVDLTGQIRSGELTRIVLAPLNNFAYWFARDLPDKILNIFFTVIELGILIALFHPPFYVPQNPIYVFGFIVVTFLVIFLYFFISMSLALVAFWTEDIWATRWLFGVIFLEFFAGSFFPIDVLPAKLANLIYLTPFPYLVFFPIKIWLEQVSVLTVFRVGVICLVWTIFFYYLAHSLWKKGVKNYGAFGG